MLAMERDSKRGDKSPLKRIDEIENESLREEARAVADDAEALRGRIVWLEPVDMETLPESANLLGSILARVDDAANWIPGRIAGLLITVAALNRAPAALRTMVRDANRHRSVNAGWQEAPMAGALGLALAGPRRYGDVVIEDAWMGDGRREATADDIRRALWVYRRAAAALAVLVGGLTFL